MSFNVGTTNNAFKANFAENLIGFSTASGSYTPTISTLPSATQPTINSIQEFSWVRLGNYVHINGNINLTLNDGNNIIFLISPPVEYDIVQDSAKPSGSIIATGGTTDPTNSSTPALVAASWRSNKPAEGSSISNTFQVLIKNTVLMATGQPEAELNFQIVYKVVA